MEKIILGIDPGSRITGFGVIAINTKDPSIIRHLSHGVILLDDGKGTFPQRMLELGKSMREICGKFEPDVVVIEQIFLGKNADSAFKLGHARGVIMYEAGLIGAEVREYATRSVKKGIAGVGSADKEQVRLVLQSLLKIPQISRIDASDALAMAYYHATELNRERIMERL